MPFLKIISDIQMISLHLVSLMVYKSQCGILSNLACHITSATQRKFLTLLLNIRICFSLKRTIVFYIAVTL